VVCSVLNSDIFFENKEKNRQKKKENHFQASRGENARLSPNWISLKYFFSPWNGTLAPALHFIIRAGMCGEWLNWFSFLIFDENNLKLKLLVRAG